MSKLNGSLVLLSLVLLATVAQPSTVRAEPIGFIERYALAIDREAALRELVPGTRDYYFYHCLHYQVTGELEQAEAMLAKLREPATGAGEYLQVMEDRQRILTYRSSPDRTIEYLRRRLDIRLDHRAPAGAGQRFYPSELDQAVLAADALVTQVEIDANQLTRSGLRHLAKRLLGQANPDARALNHLLHRIDGPWIDDLDALVIAELQLRRPEERAFGDRPAHRFLTLGQLRRVAQQVPEVKAAGEMVAETLLRLRPGEDADMRQQPQVRAEYLRRVDQYVTTLPAAYDGLKAATLYQILQSDLALGRPNKQTLLRYLRLPRNSPIVPIPRAGEPRGRFSGPLVDLSTDYMRMALLPPIGDEQPLVRTYLEHFFKDAESTQEFDGLLRREFLRDVFAEAKLLAGVAPAERWYAMLSSTRAQHLRERVELTLARDNPLRHDSHEPTKLSVDVKNIDTLVVRIYKLNTESYYRTREQLIDTDIDLDALVPTVQRQIKYSQDAVIRHREAIELDEISGRGAWIVDLMGGGLRARSLVRRGDLRHVITPSPDGLRMVVLDENRRPAAAAKLVLAGREIAANEDGVITLAPMDVQTTRTGILKDTELAVPVRFEHPAEAYELQAAMFLDRQQIQSGRMADLVLRPRLLMSGRGLDPQLLGKVAVTIVATDVDGIATTKRYDDLQLNQQSELIVSFRVPPRIAKLQATLSGRVETIATNKTSDLQTSQHWDLATIRRSSITYDAHLTRDGDRWVIEVLGLSGEPIIGATVSLAITSEFRTNPVNVTLQSDDAGRIALGELANVRSIQLSTGGVARTHDLTLAAAHWPSRLHAAVGEEIRVPLPSETDEVDPRFRLLMLRADRPEADHSENLEIRSGMLVVKDLLAGDYQLIDQQSEVVVAIAVTDGPVVQGIAAGPIRHLELPIGTPLGIASIERGDEGLRVQLKGAGPLTRVHVVAGRYHADTDPLSSLQLPELPLMSQRVWNPTSGYLSNLRLGDEYKYVMDRRYATKYPGVMLPQPGLILNPWETETTENQSQSVAAGDVMPPAAAPQPAAEAADRAESLARKQAEGAAPDFDFLDDSGVVLSNLRADENGVVIVPADAIDGMPIIQVIASDPVSLVRRTRFDSLDELPARDLRLARAIDADRAYAFVRSVVIASEDQPLDLKSLGSAQVQVYASVAELMTLLMTLSDDARLQEFRELGVWHKLDDAAKRSLYGRLACHELHLFLSIHDPDFFADVIRPYLANKKEKQLIDHYLLGNDLSAWTDQWRYADLNAAEKAILAHRVPEVRQAVLREFREVMELAPDDAQRQRRLIDVALAGRALEESVLGQGPALGLEVRDAEAETLNLNYAFGGMAGRGATAQDKPMAPQAAARRALQRAAREDRDGVVGKLAENAYFFERRRGELGKAFFQQLDPTKQWAESHWDRVRVADAGSQLIEIDPFWLAWAERDDAAPQLSEHLLRPSANRHAALVALALSGLPLEAAEVKLPGEGEPFAPPHAVAVITKRLSELKEGDGEQSILVGQRFEPVDQAKTSRGKTKDAKPAPEEFLIGTAYRGQIILTNPTPSEQVVDVLWQIPAGAVPLSAGQATDSATLTLKPFQVEKIDYEFYFPKPGEFVHYPVSVAAEATAVARGSERTFNVLAEPSKVDESSWPSIAASGTAEQIDAFLQAANLREIDWNLILHRLTDRKIYDVVMAVLRNQRIYSQAAWGYALHHRDVEGMRILLAGHDEFVKSVGPVLRSELLVVDPIERRSYEHLEYAPLVAARIHPLRKENEILNPTFLTQYRQLMRVIAYQRSPDDTQRLALTYYLLLQNRIEEAIKTFAQVDENNVETRLQYDYLAGYLAMHQGDDATAEEMSQRHRQHPVPRWRARFQSMAEHLQQRRGGGSQLVAADAGPGKQAVDQDAADLALIDREQRGAQAADDEPSVEVSVDGQTIRIRHRNASGAVLNLYAVDPELLFSKTPFVREDLASMAIVEPTRVQQIDLAAAGANGGQAVTQVQLDENLARQTLVVEAIAGPARSTALYFGGNLAAYVSEGFGQVQVSDVSTGQRVEGAYVKVYARHQDGTVKFYKDGYTDVRGRFDFVSLSTGDLATTARLAILVIDPERGSAIREASPPTATPR